jgi:hypothetical protein
LTLRELFINWLTASRFIRSLEDRLHEQRQDYTERLAEKDLLIRLLRAESQSLKMECDRMRAVLMPFGSPAGAAYAQQYQTGSKPPVVPEFTGPDDWSAELNKLYEKESKDGVSGERRQEVHEPRTDDEP